MDKVTKEFEKLVVQGKINKAKKVKDTKVDYFKAGIHKQSLRIANDLKGN